jgi:GTP cyclohydrolase IB
MRDIQNEKDERNMPIDKVGVSNVKYPISVLDRKGDVQHTVASINMYVDLPHHYRGTHMSRFIEVISHHSMNLKLDNLDKILKEILETLDCETSHLEVEFPYFIYKKSPVSGIESPMEYICRVEAKMGRNEKLSLTMEVRVPVHNLCPCSKEISEDGAHNQRGEITIRAVSSKMIWFEELIEVAESSSSAPLYTLLKREDEKFVTEQAYNNPKFVEDTARDVAVALEKDPRVSWFSVEVKNFESIHNHNAYACISRKNRALGQEKP